MSAVAATNRRPSAEMKMNKSSVCNSNQWFTVTSGGYFTPSEKFDGTFEQAQTVDAVEVFVPTTGLLTAPTRAVVSKSTGKSRAKKSTRKGRAGKSNLSANAKVFNPKASSETQLSATTTVFNPMEP
eukprot:513928_1